MNLAQDRVKWWALALAVLKFRVLLPRSCLVFFIPDFSTLLWSLLYISPSLLPYLVLQVQTEAKNSVHMTLNRPKPQICEAAILSYTNVSEQMGWTCDFKLHSDVQIIATSPDPPTSSSAVKRPPKNWRENQQEDIQTFVKMPPELSNTSWRH